MSAVKARAGGAVVAGRYELHEILGEGGAGVVFAAADRVTGARVAVKLLTAGPLNEWPRVRRELTALRLLRLPGVVTLLDDGVHEGSPFLVMSLVEGRPFPGVPTPATWESIAPAATSLLESLARVHAAGVVHRDLKPSNVLCDEDGRVTILDFGLAWGPVLGEALTTVGTIIGTPEYEAPEQFATPGGDARIDLYSFGVMLYEALTGRLPHESRDLLSLISIRRCAAPTPVRHLVPSVPHDVARVVDQLLSIDPAGRPQTAGEALRLISGASGAAAGETAFVRLDGPALVVRVVEALSAGRSVDVHGPVGSGRSRLLSEASDRLVAAGRDVRWLVPAETAYGSLTTVLGGLEDLDQLGHDEARAALWARLAERLGTGTVVVADDPERIDRWSSELVAASRDSGAVLRVVAAPTPGCVEIRELSEEDLRPLFAGPDRILHLREDAARELWGRTGGLQARVVAEISAWIRGGLARWEESRLAVTREALERLRAGLLLADVRSLPVSPHVARSGHLDELLAWIALAWPGATMERLCVAMQWPNWRLTSEVEELERARMARRLPDGRVQPLVLPNALQTWSPEQRREAHLALSRVLAPGTPFRLRHLAAAGELREVIEESLLRAPQLARDGRSGEALAVLDLGLLAARETGGAAAEERVLVAMARIALSDGSVTRVLYEASRALRRSDAVERVERLLACARDVPRGDPEEVLARLERLGPLPDAELELWRHGQEVRVAMRLPLAREGEVIAGIDRWARAQADPRALRSAASWRALHLRRCGRAREAAALFLESAERTDRVIARVADLINATLCFADDCNIDEAQRVARDARAAAARCRHALYEAYAEVSLRQVTYQRGEPEDPDPELIEVVAGLGDALLEADLCITEAARAWRGGRPADGAALAGQAVRAAESVGADVARAVARALQLVCGSPAAPGEIDALFARAAAFDDPRGAAETLGLLAIAAPSRAPEIRARVRARLGEVPGANLDSRLQILTLRESLGESAPPPLIAEPRPA